MMTRLQARRGFSLIELLVTLVITGIVTSQILGMFVNQLQVHNVHSHAVDAQEDARLVSDIILQNVRMAGYMIPSMAGISSIDGGADAADILCVSDAEILSETKVNEASSIFDRAGLATDFGVGDATVDLVPAEMDIDGDGDVDFSVGRGIIISDGVHSHCARITAIAGGDVDFLPANASGFAIPAANARAVPALIFQLTSDGLTRNGLLLSSLVEDVQVEFAVDADNDGSIGAGEFPIHDLNASVPSLVKGVRLSVMTRTPIRDPNFTGAGRQMVANRAAAADVDNFRRRAVIVNAALRNLL